MMDSGGKPLIMAQLAFQILSTARMCCFLRRVEKLFGKLGNKLDPSDLDWKNFRFMAFDQPNHPGTYQQRIDSLGTHSLPGV